jgi:hypothetical protein
MVGSCIVPLRTTALQSALIGPVELMVAMMIRNGGRSSSVQRCSTTTDFPDAVRVNLGALADVRI